MEYVLDVKNEFSTIVNCNILASAKIKRDQNF